MKKIKTACIDKLLALSSCFVITNCDKSAEDKKDGEKYGFNRLNAFVDISSSARRENMPEFADKTLKGVIDKGLPGLFYNSRIPILFRQLSPGDVIDCLTKINNSLDSGKSHDEIYSVLIYYNAFIRSFGNFGLNDDKHIDFVSLVNALGQVCNKLKNKNKNNLKKEIIDWFKPDSKKTTIPYGDIKKFFNDICIAFLCSKDVVNLTFPHEHFLSKTELDTEKAGFLICCDQIESHTSEILKKVNDDMNDWQHSDVPDETTYDGKTSDGTFGGVNHVDTIKKKNDILATIRDSNNTKFTYKNLDNNQDLTHNNPLSINTKDHINSIVAGLEEIESVLTCYADKKKEIDRDKEDFKDNFKKIDLDIERLLTALIYRGIQYNQFFVKSETLQSLCHFTTQEKPLDSLNNALQGITEYTGQILKGILQNIFAQANKIKQVTDPHQGVVSIDLTALQNQIDDFNNKILNDRILFELAYNARRYLTDLFTGDNADFIQNVPTKITQILTNHNTNNYGNFLKGVCNFLSTWDYENNKADSDDPVGGTKWACKFKKFGYNKDNNPFIFEAGTEATGFDFAFNDVQNILYEKYADCVLPETFLECQQLFKRTRDICLKDNGGLFNNIAKLHTKNDFQDNTSLRSLDLLMICLPTDGENENTFFNFFKRLPNTKNGENGEYIDEAEKWTIGTENDDKEKIIGHINKIPELVNKRKDVNNPCPKIDDAIGKLTNFILIDNPNEVIDICNSKGYKQDFEEWGGMYSLNNNVEDLKRCLENGYGVRGKDYQAADSNITLNFTFHDPKDMVAKCNEQNFGKTGTAFPALFAEENKFDVENYTSFHDNFFHIEEHLYYVLCCIKTLGASIPRQFLKNSGEDQNLLDSYRNCRNLSLLIENVLTNVLIACAKPDNVKGWKMLGWNDNCKLHTQPEGNTHWGHYDIFIGPNGKEDYKESGNFSTQYSPFYSEINTRDSYAQTWEQSFLDYKSTVTKDILPISLEDLKCGFFNSFNQGTLIWNQTDFNNYICIGNPGNPGKQIYSTYPRALYYNENKTPYNNCTEPQISLKKIIPNFQTSRIITKCGSDPRDHCLRFNEEIANKTGHISFSQVLDIYDSSNSCGWGDDDYLSLTYANTRKKYSFTTFGNDTGKKFETAKTHNFSALLNGVKDCIEQFFEFYKDKEVFTSLQDVEFNDAKSKALLKLYLRNRSIKDTNEYTSYFLNCFIKPDQTQLDALKDYIINVGKNEDRVKSFADMTHRKQFYTEIYGKTHEDSDTKKKIDRYNEVFKLFNLEELQGGSVFDQNHPILNKESKAIGSSYSNFDQRLKEKVEDFFDKVHKDWCKQVMSYTTGDADKSLLNILDGLGKKTYTTLDSNVINDFKTLKANINNIGDWFTNRYNGNSLKHLKDCVDKIGDKTTDDAALKELKDLLGTITEGTAKNAQIDPKNVKNKLNGVSIYLNDVIHNLPDKDDNELNSIFVLKPNEGKDEIAKYKDYKDKLEENKKEINEYKDWLNDYKIDIFTELKNCFDSLNDNRTTLKNLNTNIMNRTFPNDLNVLKTLLGDDTLRGSIKTSCKNLQMKLNNLNTEEESKKVFFSGKQDLSNYIQTLDKALHALPKEDPDLENDLCLIINDDGLPFLFDDTEKQSPEQIEGRFKENFDKVYNSITSQIQSLQDCIGDIDKILKAHLKAELNKVTTLLDETKKTLNSLDALTKTDNSYMETMKYISDFQNDNTKSIGKLWAGVVGYGSGALEKVVNWKRGDIDKEPFYRSLRNIQDELNGMLQTNNGNRFEQNAINISAAADTDGGAGSVTYGDRVTITQSTIIDNGDLTDMAKKYLFNDKVLKYCLQS